MVVVFVLWCDLLSDVWFLVWLLLLLLLVVVIGGLGRRLGLLLFRFGYIWIFGFGWLIVDFLG